MFFGIYKCESVTMLLHLLLDFKKSYYNARNGKCKKRPTNNKLK